MKKEIYKDSSGPHKFVRSYFSYLDGLMRNIDPEDISEVIEVFDEARNSGKRIFFIGNGGSATTAMHFANDLGAVSINKKRFKTISLVDNIANLSAIANDHSYEDIFVRQLVRLFEKGDVLVGISASGNSKNIVKAMEYANKVGGVTVGLVGFDGGIVKEIAQHSIHINTKKGQYGPVEDIHLMLDHLIVTYLFNKYTSRSCNG